MSKRARRLAAGIFPLQVEILENRLLLSAAATTTVVTSNVTNTLQGQLIALTATVTSTGGTPSGTVTFTEGPDSTVLGTATIDTTSTDSTFQEAICFANPASAPLPVGSDQITATFNATSSFAKSTGTVSVAVTNIEPTTTSLAAFPNPIQFGQTVSLTATITAAIGTPSGTVSFFDGSNLIGTGSINPTNQTAIGFTNALTAGTHNITAVYDGSSSFATSTSSNVSVVVSAPIVTTTTLVSSSSPAVVGQSIALTATVTGTSGTPTGTVTFMDGATSLGVVNIGNIDPTTQEAVAFVSSLTAGTHSITAVYSGATGFTTSTAALTLVVNANVNTTTTLAASSNPVVIGQLVAVTATVSSSGGIPMGTVTFMDGSSSIGSVAIDPTSGQAIAFTSFLTAGTHRITAVYAASGGFMGSTSSVLSETVNPDGAETTTALVVGPNPELVGQTIALQATVTALGGTPTGTVTFEDGSTIIGTVAINASTHQAIGFTNALGAGTHAISATYNGATGFSNSTSTTVNEVINPVGTLTTTTLTPSSVGLVTGQVVQLIAAVTSSGGTPAGNVTFMDGTTALFTVAIGNLSATFPADDAVAYAAFPATGMHNITAVYDGAGGFATSTSAVAHEIVNQDGTIVSVISSGNNVTAGTLVGFVATVTPEAPGGGTPTGTVTFSDGSTLLGAITLGATAGVPANEAIAFTNALPPGAQTITATYSGDTAFVASSSAGFNENIIGVPTTNVLTLSSTTALLGQTVTLTAKITGAGGTPTGTVTFTSGSSTIGTATLDGTGTATFNEYNLDSGTYPITATYSGDNTYATSVNTASASTSLAVSLPSALTNIANDTSTLESFIATPAPVGAPAAQSGQFLEMDYTGYLINGTEFDSSLNAGRTPFMFDLGQGQVIAGWDQGLVGVQAGETIVLGIPSSLAYMSAGKGSVPPNANLIFIIRAIAVNVSRLTVSFGTTTPVQLALNQPASTNTGTSFGSETVGISTAASTFTLGDADSNDPLTSIHNPIVQISGGDLNDFVITQPSTFLTQNSDGTYTGGTFTIAFKPTAVGVRSATIEIQSSDPNNPDFTFVVQGVGV